MDRSNLFVLNKLEKDVKLRDKFESVNPALKRYSRSEDAIVEREVKVKHMSLHHQQRFAKLAYSAPSILAALPLRQMLLLENERQSSCASLPNVPWMWILYHRATCTCIFLA